MIKLKFFGLGGQGVVTAAKSLSMAVSIHEGKFAITVPAYGHERRGAPVYTSIVIDDEPVLLNCFVYEPDVVMVTDDCIADRKINVGAGISEQAVLVLNTAKEETARRYKEEFGFHDVYYVDATHIAINNIGRSIPNSAMLGALAKAGIVGIDSVEQAVVETFGEKAGERNAKAARAAYEATKRL